MKLKIIYPKKVVIRDSTLREGLDVPGVSEQLTEEDKFLIAKNIHNLGIREFDIIHPGRVNQKSLNLAKKIKKYYGDKIILHGAVYAFNPNLAHELSLVKGVIDKLDFVMPVTEQREPFSKKDKVRALLEAFELSKKLGQECGVGFANSSQVDTSFLLEISRRASKAGAEKIIVYDTIGKFDPLETYNTIKEVKSVSNVPVLYHCHNDIGLATANSLFAAYGGADFIDATINGIGDRAGNTALEQLAVIFHLKGVETGIQLKQLKQVSDLVEKLTGFAKAQNHPIVGDPSVILSHVSPKHKTAPKAFEILHGLGIKNLRRGGYPGSTMRGING